ncbi:MAG: pyridoxamine 5'-phosphate oxidase family protein [Chloroflexota bacterium]|nr:pyridoxamine 5'-phosphate oxidase family protein [Chloroflexota bacterium]
MTPEEQKKFLAAHRLAIVGIARKDRGPHMSPVYYALDGGDILISTTASRWKAKAIRRNPSMSLCIIGEAMPFPYLLLYGTAVIEDHGAPGVMRKIGERMTGNPIPDSALPAIEERAKTEGRVVLRFTPEKVGGTAYTDKRA